MNRTVRSSLVKLVVFLVVTGLTSVFLGMTLDQARDYGTRRGYSALFTDASYLTPGSDVRIAGVPVGTVRTLRLRPDSTVLIGFDVAADTPMPSDVRLAIHYKNLIGDRYLQLSPGPDSRSPRLPVGATIPLTQTTPALDLDTLTGGFRPLFAALNPQQVNEPSGQLIAVFQGQAGTVGDLVSSVAGLTTTLADRDQLINSVIVNLRTALGAVDAHDTQLTELVDQLQGLVGGLAEDRRPLGEAIDHLNVLAGSATELLSDIRPDLRATLASTGSVAGTLNTDNDKLVALLTGLSPVLRSIGGVGAYGSFLSGYVCAIRYKTVGADGLPVYSPWMQSQEPRCGGNGRPR